MRKTALLWILLLAALLRFYGIADESLWLDEGLVADRISHDYKTLLTDWDSQRQGPLFTVIEKTWCDQFGDSEFNLRLMAALFGVLTIIWINLLGKELFGKTAGLLAALFTAMNPFTIHFSQDARPYTLFMLCSIASLLYFVRMLRGNRAMINQFLFDGFAACALYSHPYGPFLVIAYMLTALGYYGSARESIITIVKRLMAGAIAVAVLYAPMLFIFARTFIRKMDQPTIAGSWLHVEPLSAIAKAIGQYFMDPLLGITISALIVIVVARKITRDKSWNFSLSVVLSLLVSFLFIPWVITAAITPIYYDRYTIPALGAVLVLLGYTLSLIPVKSRAAVILVLILLHIFPLYNFYTKVDKDPWRQTVALLERECQPDDMILLMPTFASGTFKYYYEERDDVLYRTLRLPAEFRSIPDNIDRVWFVFAHYHAPRRGDAVLDSLSNWGTQMSSVQVNQTLQMNPHLCFATDIEVTRFDRK